MQGLRQMSYLVSVWMICAAAGGEILAGPAAAGSDAQAVLRHFGVVGDGQHDDTAALQKWVDAGRGDLRLPRGVYRISAPVVIELDKVGPTSVIGSGTARIVMTGAGPGLRFLGTHDGTASPATVKPNVWKNQRSPAVNGIEIVGGHQQADGIEAAGTMQLMITRVTVRKARHAVHLVTRNRNVIVSDCNFYENRGVGLYLDDVNLHQINVSASHISYNGGGGIVVRAGNVRNLQVSGCDIEGNMAPDGEPTANILIDGTGGAAGIAEVAIVGCTIQHSPDAPHSANIRFVGIDDANRQWGNITIGNNVLSDVQINVDIQRARGVCIVGNTFWKGVQYDLRVENSSQVVVGPNLFDRNPRYQDQQDADHGLLFSNCHDTTLTGLHIAGVRRKEAGLILRNCSRLNVTGCTVLDCQTAGILLDGVVKSRLSGCLVDGHPSDGRPWRPLLISDNCDVLLSDNLLGDPVVGMPPSAAPGTSGE